MSDPDYSQVQVGGSVKIRLEDGTEKIYMIGSSKESDPKNGVISDACPIGKALIGSRTGDTVSYRVGENTFTVRVLEISR